MRARSVRLGPLVTLWVLLSGCSLSTSGGALGLVDFTASGCGAALGGLTGCDLRLPIALGARVDVTAKLRQDGRPLTLRSSDSAVLGAPAPGNGDTVVGKAPGRADLWAQRDGQDIDRIQLAVLPIAQFAYSQLSDPSGTFTATPGMDADGTFEVTAGLRRFGLVMALLGEGGARLLGRDGATWKLPAGLTLAKDAGQPEALHFEFERPIPGSYPLALETREGGVQAKILLVVK